jgi:hypothetical protein
MFNKPKLLAVLLSCMLIFAVFSFIPKPIQTKAGGGVYNNLKIINTTNSDQFFGVCDSFNNSIYTSSSPLSTSKYEQTTLGVDNFRLIGSNDYLNSDFCVDPQFVSNSVNFQTLNNTEKTIISYDGTANSPISKANIINGDLSIANNSDKNIDVTVCDYNASNGSGIYSTLQSNSTLGLTLEEGEYFVLTSINYSNMAFGGGYGSICEYAKTNPNITKITVSSTTPKEILITTVDKNISGIYAQNVTEITGIGFVLPEYGYTGDKNVCIDAKPTLVNFSYGYSNKNTIVSEGNHSFALPVNGSCTDPNIQNLQLYISKYGFYGIQFEPVQGSQSTPKLLQNYQYNNGGSEVQIFAYNQIGGYPQSTLCINGVLTHEQKPTYYNPNTDPTIPPDPGYPFSSATTSDIWQSSSSMSSYQPSGSGVFQPSGSGVFTPTSSMSSATTSNIWSSSSYQSSSVMPYQPSGTGEYTLSSGNLRVGLPNSNMECISSPNDLILTSVSGDVFNFGIVNSYANDVVTTPKLSYSYTIPSSISIRTMYYSSNGQSINQICLDTTLINEYKQGTGEFTIDPALIGNHKLYIPTNGICSGSTSAVDITIQDNLVYNAMISDKIITTLDGQIISTEVYCRCGGGGGYDPVPVYLPNFTIPAQSKPIVAPVTTILSPATGGLIVIDTKNSNIKPSSQTKNQTSSSSSESKPQMFKVNKDEPATGSRSIVKQDQNNYKFSFVDAKQGEKVEYKLDNSDFDSISFVFNKDTASCSFNLQVSKENLYEGLTGELVKAIKMNNQTCDKTSFTEVRLSYKLNKNDDKKAFYSNSPWQQADIKGSEGQYYSVLPSSFKYFAVTQESPLATVSGLVRTGGTVFINYLPMIVLVIMVIGGVYTFKKPKADSKAE